MPNQFTTDCLDEKYLQEFYQSKEGFSWAYETLSGYSEFASIRKFELIMSLIRKMKPENILDNGCGGGLFIRSLAKGGFRVVGFDLSLNLLLKIKSCLQAVTCLRPPACRAKATDKRNSQEGKLPLIAGDSQKLSFKNNSFSLCLCSEVLEHIPDCEKTVEEISRVLEEDGKAIITVPNLHCYDSLEGRFRIISRILRVINYGRHFLGKEDIYKYGYNTHLHKYTPFQWRKILEKNGLKVTFERPVFISPYIPQVIKPLKRLEKFLYSKDLIFKLQNFVENYLSLIYPFKFLGQLHLFICKKRSL